MNLVDQITNLVSAKPGVSAIAGKFDSKQIKSELLSNGTPFVTVFGENLNIHTSSREAQTFARQNKCAYISIEDGYMDYKKF